ncbi:MAG: hypothetical protein ACI9C4_002975 [Paraglaciecola sp.]|jgi:hypothetical protein
MCPSTLFSIKVLLQLPQNLTAGGWIILEFNIVDNHSRLGCGYFAFAVFLSEIKQQSLYWP